jgi:P4 family phage/plasmid primase-like protien
MEDMASNNNIENVIISSSAKTSIKYKNFTDCLKKNNKSNKTEGSESSSPTHTRIGDRDKNIYAGSYSIQHNEWNTFMSLYWSDVVEKNKTEYLTEKQLSTELAPIAIDLDLHFEYSTEERIYSQDHLDDLVDVYLAELKEMFCFDENTTFPIFLFEKDNINRVKDKKITKDGIHMIIGVQMKHDIQEILRKNVIPKVKEIWGDFPIINTWNDVFDEGITKGYTNWQLYGSCKPDHDKYKLTNVYEISYDTDDGELINNRGNPSDYLTKEKFTMLSVRYQNHLNVLYQNSFLEKLENNNNSPRKKSRKFTFDESSSGSTDISQIKNADELDNCLQQFLETIPSTDYMLREIYEYTTVLPESYYGQGSYAKWIRVGWALKNTSNKLLIVWIAFSAKSSTFDYNSISEICEQWDSFSRKESGVTNRSIIYWAKQDNPSGAEGIRKNTIGYYLDMTINAVTANAIANPSKTAKGSTDYDIAVVLHQMFKDEYVCADVKGGAWFRFFRHRWVEVDCGSTLRKSISNELRQLYEDKATQLNHYLSTIDPEDDQYKQVKARIDIVIRIIQRLGQTSDKKNIMQEARDLFEDTEFYNRLDSDPYLLGCKNGVIDFKEKSFRKGRPEDYVTKCTNVDYFPLSHNKHVNIIPQLEDFMEKLFVKEELRQYMWDHLSAVLIGMPSLNQALYNYIGIGQNGKSVLTDLMTHTLGTYKCAAPISLITQGRGKIGGLAPEIVGLKGCRYVVMQEPESTDVIHEGPMKELVSGVEPITARAPYQTRPVTFIPQFALTLCCNQLPNVRTQDHGTWRRLKVVKFESLFTDNPVTDDNDRPYQFMIDRDILTNFPVWKETFLAMLVQRAYENNGRVVDCDAVLEASTKYRESQDHVSQFIGERITKRQGSKVRKEQLSEEFKLWFMVNCGKTKQPSPKQVYEYMDRIYGKSVNSTWMNVKLTYPSDNNNMVAADDTDSDNGNNIIEVPDVEEIFMEEDN